MLGAKLLILLCIAFMADAQYRRPPPPRPNPGRPSRPAANPMVAELDPNSIPSEPVPEIPNEEINTTPAPVMTNAPASYPRPVPARPSPPNRPSYMTNGPLPPRPNRPGQPGQFAPIPNPSENNREPETPGVVIDYPEKNSTEEASSDPVNNLPPSNPPIEEYVPEPTFPDAQPEVIVPPPPNRPSYRPNRPLPSRPTRPDQPSQFDPISNPSDNNREPVTPGVVIDYPEKNSTEEASSDPVNNLPPSNPPTEEYVPEPTFPDAQPEVIVPPPPNRPSYRPNRPLPSRPTRPDQPSQFDPISNPSDNNREPEMPGVVIVYPEKNSEEASSDPINYLPPSNPPTEEYVPEPTFPDPQPEDYPEFSPNYFYPEEQPETGFEHEPLTDDEYEPIYPQPDQPNYVPELPETQPEYEPEAQPEYEPETQPEYKPETQPEYEPEPDPEAEPEQKPEFESEGNPGFPETYPEESFPASEPEEELFPVPELEPELFPQPETETELFPEPKPDSELFPEPNLSPETEPIFDPLSDPYPTEPSDPLTLQPSYPEEPEITTHFPLYDMDGEEPPKRENETEHETPYHPPTTEVYLPPITITPRPIYTSHPINTPRPIYTPRPFYTPRTTPRLHTNPTTHPTPRPTPPPTPITSPSSITPEPVPPALGPVNVIPLKPVMPVLPNRPTASPLRPSSPIQSQPIIDYTCRDPDAYYSIPNECDTFIQCKQSIARKYVCPDGLLFNPRAYWPQYPCVYPSQVRCNNKTVMQKPRPIGECPRRYGNFPSRTGDCGQFLVCHDGHATLMNCPQGLAFNIRSGGCDWPEKVPSCKSNVFAGFQCPAPSRDDNGRISDRVNTFRYRASCKEYIACLKGEPRLLRCDQGLSFDEITGRCIDSDAVINCQP